MDVARPRKLVRDNMIRIQDYIKSHERAQADEYIREEAWKSLFRGYWLSVMVVNDEGEPYIYLVTDSIDAMMEEVWECVEDDLKVFVQGVEAKPSGKLFWNTRFNRDASASAKKVDTYFRVEFDEEDGVWVASAENLSAGFGWGKDFGEFDCLKDAKMACEGYYAEAFSKLVNPERFRQE